MIQAAALALAFAPLSLAFNLLVILTSPIWALLAAALKLTVLPWPLSWVHTHDNPIYGPGGTPMTFVRRFKAALWSWLLFWIFGKRQMAAFLENYFIDNRFPAPHELAPDLEDYLGEVSNNVEIDATTRVKAAYELGTLNGFKTARRYSLVLQVNLAGRVVLERYARLSKRFAQ